MWSALGSTFGLAMGLALSPLAITTALILLLGDRGKLRAVFFAVGWWVAMFGITLIPMLVTDGAEEDDPSGTSGGVDILHLVFGVLFFVLAALTWIKRPNHDRAVKVDEAEESALEVVEQEMLDVEPAGKPGILDRLDGLGVWACLLVGLAQGVLIIKNIPLGISAGAQIGQAQVPQAEQWAIVAIFAAIATAGALIPLLTAVVGGRRVEAGLYEARHWIEANMTAITLVVLVVVGGIFLGEGLGLAD
ncbi:GAP family protein [Gordonia sp. PP30]|uniref:GAP family protein n=1 Tax=Gordonia sp. PP30 TaxID=2935861 RepID=UPI001FFF949A|nr:GAP family protein [Gordonia sp. PP30]UQE75556.1 GAP family protein [Gordonia sp. PP30]